MADAREYEKKVCALTNLPTTFVERITDMLRDVILEDIYTNKTTKEPFEVEVQEYGKLIISMVDGEPKIGFSLSQAFIRDIKSVLDGSKNPMIERIEERLAKKLVTYYKELY